MLTGTGSRILLAYIRQRLIPGIAAALPISEQAKVAATNFMSQMLQKYGHQVLDKLEQDAPQGVEHSEESNQAQLLTDKAA